METRRFDHLTIAISAGASRRRMLSGFGGVAMVTLLGRTATARSSTSERCLNDCNAQAKEDRKACANAKSKDKHACLQAVKSERVGCRQACGRNDESDSETDGDTSTDGVVTIQAKAECDPLNGGDAFCQSTVADTCLIGTCSKLTTTGKYRCAYTRDKTQCSGTNHVCCNYRDDSPTSGQCVAHAEECKA